MLCLVAPVGAGAPSRAPWRIAVRLQSMPVSPPPSTTTRCAAHADERLRGAGKSELVIDVGNEIRQRLVHARQVLPGEAALHGGVGAHAEEHRIVFLEQLLEARYRCRPRMPRRNSTPMPCMISRRFSTHFLLELERRDAEGEQAADARVAIEHHRLHAVAHQHVGAAQARRARTDDRHAPAGRPHVRHVGLPAALEAPHR